MTSRCWCGSEDLSRFDDGYLACKACGSLLAARMPAADVTRPRRADDLYGRRYWFEHQRELGLGDLEERRRNDLAERCVHWLRTVFAYRRPPGRALELGCAHGGFTALLREAGFDATGLELDPWVVGEARRTFGVPVLQGPLEDQDLAPGSLDMVVAMDVLEHLPRPLATLSRCRELLAPGGVVLIQTPCRPDGLGRDALEAAGHRFLELLLPEEHLVLYTRDGVRELCRRAGLPHLAFEPAFFGHYDMAFVAGREPLERRDDEPAPALVRTLLEVDRDRTRLAESFRQADADRVGRQARIDELEKESARAELHSRRTLAGLEADLAEREERVAELEAARQTLGMELGQARDQLAALRADLARAQDEAQAQRARLAEKEATIAGLGDALAEKEVALAAQADALAEKESVISAQGAMLAEKEAVISAQGATLAEKEATIAAQRDARARLDAALAALRETNERRRRDLETLRGEQEALTERHASTTAALRGQDVLVERLEARAAAAEARLAGREEQVAGLRALLEDHRHSRVFTTLVRLGRWRAFDLRLERALAGLDLPPADASEELIEEAWEVTNGRPAAAGRPRRPAYAVDLTALLPGGENGGAKQVALELVRAFGRLAPEVDLLLLLTSAPCHAELAALETANVRRVEVRPEPAALSALLARETVDLLFCPMTAPPFSDPLVPLVCLVHDLQFATYPEFFSDADRAFRAGEIDRATRLADRLITVSESVRKTVLDRDETLAAGDVVAIHHGLAERLPRPDAAAVAAVLEHHGLAQGGYFLYPANFWPHKNHRMLLTAFALLRRRGVELALVLTGAERPDPAPIRDAARRMGLDDAVVFAGWVGDGALAALITGSRALVFPSLYEGFGMPLVEAMHLGRPVAASDVTSLPEVAGGAALLFDPRRPEAIADALERLATDDALAAELVERGRRRAAEIGGVERMARAYLDVLRDAARRPHPFAERLAGVWADGWSAGRFVVSFAASEVPRELELGLANPSHHHAGRRRTVRARSAAGLLHETTLATRQSLLWRCRLPSCPGYLELNVEPTFSPAQRGLSDDARELGLQVWCCRIRRGDEDVVDLLEAVP